MTIIYERMTLSLTTDEARRLEAEAEKRNISRTELIRRALEEYTSATPAQAGE